jgi:uncharacterized protein
MSITYLDTSALIKRYIQEPGSEALSAAWSSFSIFGSAVIIHVEISAALSKASRLGALDNQGAQLAWQAFLNDWVKLSLVNIGLSVINRASSLAWDHGLRCYDAVHLAAALIWQEAMGETVHLCTFDNQLWKAAQLLDMKVWPENLAIYTDG